MNSSKIINHSKKTIKFSLCGKSNEFENQIEMLEIMCFNFSVWYKISH